MCLMHAEGSGSCPTEASTPVGDSQVDTMGDARGERCDMVGNDVAWILCEMCLALVLRREEMHLPVSTPTLNTFQAVESRIIPYHVSSSRVPLGISLGIPRGSRVPCWSGWGRMLANGSFGCRGPLWVISAPPWLPPGAPFWPQRRQK
jgi:hypothetical protein